MPWCSVTLLHCYTVALLPCYFVTLSPCWLVTLLPCYSVTLPPCYSATLLFCHPVILSPCYSVILLPCYPVTLLFCYPVTLLLCYSVTLLFCYPDTLLPCYSDSMLHCFSVTLLPCYTVSLLLCYLNQDASTPFLNYTKSLLGWAFTKTSPISSTSNLSGQCIAITAIWCTSWSVSWAKITAQLPHYWLVGCMQWEEDDGCLEKHPRHMRQVLVEDCLEVPSLLTATWFAIFAAHSQGICEMEGHSLRTTCLLLLQIAPGCF